MKLKIILISVVLVLFGLVSLSFYKTIRSLKEDNENLNSQLSNADLELGRAATLKTSLYNEIDMLDDQIKLHIKKNSELITEVAKWKAKQAISGETKVVIEEKAIEIPVEINLEDLGIESNQFYYTRVSSMGTLFYPLGDELKFEDFRLKATIGFNDGLLSNKPGLTLKYDFVQELYGTLVRTVNQNGNVSFYLKLKAQTTTDKYEDIPLASFEVVTKDLSEKKFNWFNPKLDLGFISGIDSSFTLKSGATFGTSIMSYGKTDNDLSWRFIRLGLDVRNTSLGLNFTPVMWNFGDVIPLISNLWIGPQGSIDLTKNSSLGLLITVGL
jgi:hypothetical protein